MKFNDSMMIIEGGLHLTAIDRQGNVLFEYDWKNLITDVGYRAAAEALANVTGAAITHIGMGTNSTTPANGDTAITNAVMVPVQSVEYPNTEFRSSMLINFSVDFLVAVGMNIYEWGTITGDGRLFSRLVRAPIIKTNEMMLLGQWVINIKK